MAIGGPAAGAMLESETSTIRVPLLCESGWCSKCYHFKYGMWVWQDLTSDDKTGKSPSAKDTH